MTFTELLEASADLSNVPDTDLVALQIARMYANRLDIAVTKGDTKAMNDFGPKLLTTLTALGMTQAGRAAKKEIEGGAADDSTDNAAATFAKLRSQFN